jgi:crotonobetainyl-CoA:carnitine CoA-transferase CaiB-like acyl-CoA transferase
VFATRDGHVLTHVVGNGLFRRWTRLMGEESRWCGDARFATDQSRGDHAEPILARMREWCAARTNAEVLRELEAAGIPAGEVYTPQRALDDPQVAAMHMLASVAAYPGLPRPAPVPELPVRLSVSGGGINGPPPQLGEHTQEILQELGFAPEQIRDLRDSGVI